MNTIQEAVTIRRRIQDALFLGMTPGRYALSCLTWANTAAALLMLPGLYLIILRFTKGLAAVTGASQEQPWGLLLSWGLFAGVPLSSTGFLLTTAEFIFGVKKIRPVVRNAVLLGFLGYLFAVIFLLIDLGRPWRIYYPMTWAFGPASVMFLIAWHVALYLSCQALELAPAACEWLKLQRLRRLAVSLTLGLTIGGIILSTLHQSALGAMFLLAPGKVHPLWYSSYLPWLFFLSSIACGLSFVILVSFLNKRLAAAQADAEYLTQVDAISLGLGKGCVFALFAYLGLKLVALAHSDCWDLLRTSWGTWYLLEIAGFVMLPLLLFIIAERKRSLSLVRLSALITVIGVILNRFNVTLVAFNWRLPDRELFAWKEFFIILALVVLQIRLYQWIIRRLPILRAPGSSFIETGAPSW